MRLPIPLLDGNTLSGLTRSLVSFFNRLDAGLRQLDFDENFDSFATELVIPASSELRIANKLKKIPTRYIVEESTSGALIKKSGTWDSENLYISNLASTEEFIGRVRFFR